MRIDYQEIEEAAKLLGLGDRASLKQVKEAYRKLMHEWHPDRCKHDKEICNEKAIKITEAYKLLIAFCNSYKIPLTEQKLVEELAEEDPEAFWKRKFGSDPHWGGPGYG
ncbi:MAG: DnaJ domain-containing protein [Spirochaetota bacterium]